MGVQEILVACLFLLALFYVGRMIYRNVKTDKSCGGCGKCGADFSNIENKL